MVAYAPALELATQGKTLAQAKKMFGEALNLFMEDLLERGKLEQALQELGWQKVNRRWQLPKQVVRQEVQTLTVPV